MYSKQEASQLRQEFWTVFGKYMLPILSVEGEKVNWINYKTGEKNIYFKMDADNKTATISIQLNHPDKEIRSLYFQQFIALKKILTEALNEEWKWKENTVDDLGIEVSKIYKSIEGVSIYKKEDWPTLISFFKPGIIALDEFWSSAKYSFRSIAMNKQFDNN